MSAYITTGTEEHRPLIITGYRSARDTRTIAHQLLESADVAFTRRPAALRKGTMRALFATRELADSFNTDLLDVISLNLIDPALLSSQMKFVPLGDVELEIDTPKPRRWWVQFNYQEISS